MSYALLRQLLFCLPPETAHRYALKALDSGIGRWLAPSHSQQACQVMGLDFPNPVGLAAGLDKNADHLAGLFSLGFGFVEVGTVTPKPQTGNPQPRLFRLPEQRALINRLGFNNLGVNHLCRQVEAFRQRQPNAILGINIGKNASTPLENAMADYLFCLRKVYPLASYVTVNLSSPNTPGLRQLQHGDALRSLLDALKQEQHKLQRQHRRYVPLVIKIAPDLNSEEINNITQAFNDYGVDAAIATNTTFARPDAVAAALHGQETGGLSGEPLTAMATQVLQQLHAALDPKIALIGVGGIHDFDSAKSKFTAGAQLVQLYTGFIYQGPKLIATAMAAARAASETHE